MPSSTSRRALSSAPRTLLALWTGILAGPLVYLLDLELSYALANRACEAGSAALYALTTAAAAAIVAAAGLLSWREWRRLPESADMTGARAVDRNRFLAVSGLAFSAGFLLLIVSNFVPKFMLGVCD